MLQEKPNFKQMIHKTRMYETLPVQVKIELLLELLSNFWKLMLIYAKSLELPFVNEKSFLYLKF